MGSNQADNVAHIAISFRSERADESPAWGRAGLTALEQAEANLETDGVSMSLERATAPESEGARGFVDTLVVNIVADAITTLLFHAATDLIIRWQRMLRRAPAANQPEGAGAGCDIILRAGDHQLAIPFDTPDDQIYHQLALWSPHVLEAGNVAFEVKNNEV